MERHKFFKDILLHTDKELAGLLKAEIVKRETIHEWPLSCVQRLVLDNGKKLIYKSQLPPTVEPLFYESASSKLLPDYDILGRFGLCDIMTIEWIDAPMFGDIDLSESEVFDSGMKIINEIGKIKGNLPVYLDIGSIESWSAAINASLKKLIKLIKDGSFKLLTYKDVEDLKTWAVSDSVLNAVTEHPQVSHGDLKADQVFLYSNGYRLIDWQRPILAPPEIDLVSLLFSRNIEPRRYVASPIVGIYWFLYLYWAVEAQSDLFPDFHGSIFDEWTYKAKQNILA